MQKFLFALLVVLGCGSSVLAQVTETEVTYDIEVTDLSGKKIKQKAYAVLWRDSSKTKPQPLLIYGHGRVGPGMIQLFMTKYARENATWFASLGYTVLAPSRLGYGKTGGDDIEAGSCWGVPFKVGFDSGADQLAQAIRYGATLPGVDGSRAVYVGLSVGGAVAIALSSLNVPNLVSVINFSGGAGGNPKRNPKEPCNKDEQTKIYSDYGKTARTPTLWIYAENDYFWGADLPKLWFDGYIANGGLGEFKLYPPQGFEGHNMYTNQPETWQPFVLAHFKKLGLPSQ